MAVMEEIAEVSPSQQTMSLHAGRREEIPWEGQEENQLLIQCYVTGYIRPLQSCQIPYWKDGIQQ